MAFGTWSLAMMLPMATQPSPCASAWAGFMRAPWKWAVRPPASMAASCRQPWSGVLATRAAMVSAALQPLASSATPRGPRRGSVRCCVSTPPVRAARKGTRAPMPMEEVVQAAPNWPVRGQCPRIEKVMPPF
jgi:hypothetical protein